MNNKKHNTNKSLSVTEYIFAAVLFVYALRNVTRGVDLMDAGYTLGNYQFFDVMNEHWRTATYLSNVIGVLCTKLPFGDMWTGMNFYSSVFIGLTAAAAYVFLVRCYGKQNKRFKYLFFMAELVALSVCWAPTVNMYQYFGYLMMTAATMVLYTGIKNDKKTCYFVAGVILGLCVMVRMPNITYMAFVLPVWYFIFADKEKNNGCIKWFNVLINRTLICILGYLAGLIPVLMVICIKYGINAYPQMIIWLFGMTETATDYKPTSMITAMLGDYISYSIWFLLFVAYMLAGIMGFACKNKIVKKYEKKAGKNNIIGKTDVFFKMAYILGFLVVLRLCYGRGMFDFNYASYFSMYKWLTVYLLMVIIFCVSCLVIHKEKDNKKLGDLKLWAVFLLITIFITPLGSNNGLYPIINNLFLVAPVSVYMIMEILSLFDKTSVAKKISAFVYRSVIIFVFVCTAIQSIGFGASFIFHDSPLENEKRVEVELHTTDRLDGLKTTSLKKRELEALEQTLYDNALLDKNVLLYGDIPALAYIFDMSPAVFTTWPDLDSNGIDYLQRDLKSITETKDYPVVILGKDSIQYIKEDSLRHRKLLAIYDFMNKNGYNTIYESDMFMCAAVGEP